VENCISVKSSEKWCVSQFANNKSKAGDALEVGKPEGKFLFESLQADRQKNLCRICIWQHNTYCLSIIKSVMKK
jgi:ring-1,2-phenylacetyl-CoA epoxidase subunit PaaE